MARRGFDYNNFQTYRDNFSKLTKDFDRWLNKFLLGEGMRFIAGVKPKTPVDTGDLRNHWQLDGITREGDELKVWFVNPMEYATFVEYGHAKPYKSGASPGSADWVDGFFMMTVTLAQIERTMPIQFSSAFNALLNQYNLL